MYNSSTQLCQKHHTHKSFSFTLPTNLNTSYYRNYYINSYEMYTYLYLFIIIGNNYNSTMDFWDDRYNKLKPYPIILGEAR